MEANKQHRRGVLALLGTTLLWATTFVMMKSALGDVPPFWVMTLRFSGAALLLLVISGKRLKKLDRGTVIGGTKMGLLLFAAYYLMTLGLELISPGKNAFLITGYTIVTPFIAWAWHKTRPDGYNLIAAAMCFVGMGLASLSGPAELGKGELLTISSGLFYALHIVCSGRETQGRDPILITLVQMATIAVLSFAGALIWEEFPTNVPAYTWANLAYLSIVCTGLCFLLQTYGQKYTTPMETSIILPFESVFGALFSVAMGEQIHLREGIGYALMFLAAIVSEAKPGQKRE